MLRQEDIWGPIVSQKNQKLWNQNNKQRSLNIISYNWKNKLAK